MAFARAAAPDTCPRSRSSSDRCSARTTATGGIWTKVPAPAAPLLAYLSDLTLIGTAVRPLQSVYGQLMRVTSVDPTISLGLNGGVVSIQEVAMSGAVPQHPFPVPAAQAPVSERVTRGAVIGVARRGLVRW